jgi:hypothetical protein
MNKLKYTITTLDGDTFEFDGYQSEFVAEGRMLAVTLSHSRPHVKTFNVKLIAEMTTQAYNE